MLEVINLTRGFGSGRKRIKVLSDVNFSLAAGETAAVLGRSGSGKSTLLSLLAGLDRPCGGEIIIAGKYLGSLNENELAGFRARQVGIIFQQYHLLPHLTAHENVSLAYEISRGKGSGGAFAEVKQRAAEALAAVGLEKRLRHLPSMLSGGEQQRVALARSLIMEPPLLLADEPSGSLDEQTGKEVTDLLFHLIAERKTTFIVATHDRALASRCKRVFTLEGGSLRHDSQEHNA